MKKLFCIILLLLCLTANVGQSQHYHPVKMFGQQLNLGHRSTEGLVFYWRGIPAGNVVDESPYGNHGTINGNGLVWVGDFLDFTGLADYIAIPTLNMGTQNTAIVRICFDVFVGVLIGHVAFNDGGYFMAFTATDIFYSADGQITNVTHGISTGEWVTLAVSRSGTAVTFYKNGFQLGATGTLGANSDLTVSAIGAFNQGNNDIDGQMSDIKIYNRALLASEILELYINPGLPMKQDPIWLMYSPDVGGIVPIIQAHRRRRAG